MCFEGEEDEARCYGLSVIREQRAAYWYGIKLATESMQRSLGNLDFWVSDPVEAHKVWRGLIRYSGRTGSGALGGAKPGEEGVSYAASSNRVYEAYWAVFCRWMTEWDLDIRSVESEQITEFLLSVKGRNDGEPSVRTVRMYMAEISRVFDWLYADARAISVNPATPVRDAFRITHAVSWTVYPPDAGFVLRYEAAAEMLYESELAADPEGWVPQRNLALRLVASQCGLTLKEICALTLEDISPVGGDLVSVRAPGHGVVRARTLVGSKRLRKILDAWIERRYGLLILPHLDQEGTAGERNCETAEVVRLFVGINPALRNSETAVLRMSKDRVEAYVAECVRLAASTAGRPATEHGPRYLRTAFAAQKLESGLSDDRVRELMGLKTTSSIAAIRKCMGPHSTQLSLVG